MLIYSGQKVKEIKSKKPPQFCSGLHTFYTPRYAMQKNTGDAISPKRRQNGRNAITKQGKRCERRNQAESADNAPM